MSNNGSISSEFLGKAGIVIDFFEGPWPLPTFTFKVYHLLSGLFGRIGHTFPIFAGFKGGKAVATSAE